MSVEPFVELFIKRASQGVREDVGAYMAVVLSHISHHSQIWSLKKSFLVVKAEVVERAEGIPLEKVRAGSRTRGALTGVS